MRALHAIAILLPASALAGPAMAGSINFLTWESYISPDVLEDFTRQTGIEVHQIYYDDGDKLDEILSSADSGIDVAILSESSARMFGRKGRMAERRNMPGAGDPVGDRFLERCGSHSQPYLWGTLGIVYRTDKIERLEPSWSSLLQPDDRLAGHVAMMTDYTDGLVPALISVGSSVNAVDIETLRKVFALMKAQGSSVLTYQYVVSSAQDPAFRDKIHMALAYSGDDRILSEQAGKPGLWKYVLPREGTLVWLDCLAAVRGSANEKQAQAFIDFLARADVAARNANYLRLPPANPEAIALLPAEMRDDLSLMKPEQVIAKGEFSDDLPGKGIQIRKRIVTSLVNFHDTP